MSPRYGSSSSRVGSCWCWAGASSSAASSVSRVGALGVEVGETGPDPLAEGLGGRVGRVGGGFQLGDQRGLGRIEPGDLAADGGGLLVAALGAPGGGGGQLGGQHGGPVGAEHPLGEEPGQRGGP